MELLTLDHFAGCVNETFHAALNDGDGRTIADLLVDQVEFADVLVISKTDLISAEEAQRLEAILRSLNPGAHLIRAAHGEVPLAELTDYASRLKSMTGGHGSFVMTFARHAAVPPIVQQKLASQHVRRVEED